MPLDHHWTVLSRHPTSVGTVVYESCHCGMQRMRQVVSPAGGPVAEAPVVEALVIVRRGR